MGKQAHLLNTMQNPQNFNTVMHPQTTKQGAAYIPSSLKSNIITPAGGNFPKSTTYAQGPQGSRNLHSRAVSSLGPQEPVISNLMAHNPNKVKRGSSVVGKAPLSN